MSNSDQKEDCRQGEISKVIDSIDSVISQVDKELSCLRERLLPILRAEDTAKEGGCQPKPSCSCSLAGSLNEQKERLARIAGLIAEMHSSVEL